MLILYLLSKQKNMSEIPQPPNQQETLVNQELQESQLAFVQQAEVLGQHIPEIVERPEIMEAGKQLIEQFAIRPSLFESEDRALVFVSIASRLADSKQIGPEQAEAEHSFIADTMALLAHEHSDQLQEASQLIQTEQVGFDDEAQLHAYDRYTDKQLSDAVKQKIDEGFLDDVKQKLGVTAENEDPYELRVLSIGNDSQFHGLDAPAADYSLPYNHPDLEDAKMLLNDVSQWKKGMRQRNAELAKEMGRETTYGPAWVTDISGKRLLCISGALAEKIIDPSVVENSLWYTADQLERELAILRHEYTHTQGGVMVDRDVNFGINLEELRAEHYSGNRQGYKDIKDFFSDYHVITGQNMSEEFESKIKGGTTTEAFGLIAAKVGMSKMLEVILATPGEYIGNQSNPFTREAHTYLGGLDGVLENLYDREVQQGNEQVILERFEPKARWLAEQAKEKPGFIDKNYLAMRRKEGCSFLAEKIAARAREILAQEQDT